MVSQLSNEDLRTFSFTLGLLKDYKGKRNSCANATERSAVKSPQSSVKEEPVTEIMADVEQKLDESISSITDQPHKLNQRIGQIEFSIDKMGAYVEESVSKFTKTNS